MKKTGVETDLAGTWLPAWQLRCCPPDDVLAGKLTDQLREHLEVCPICSCERAAALPPVQLNLPMGETADQQEPQPGELWSLHPSLGGWGTKKRYYNPPVILVTGRVVDNAVRVVQTFGDSEFAGSDDLLLDNGLTGFAEPWNQYTLQVNALHTCLGHISQQLTARLQNPSDKTPSTPESGSLLWFFRQMEVETGWYFAEQSLAALLGSIEKTSLPAFPDIPAAVLLTDLKKLPVILPAIDAAALPEDILAGTMPADDLLPLAAAELQPQRIQVLLFSVAQNTVQTVELLSAEVTVIEQQEAVLHISGCCSSDIADNAVWMFRWQSDSWSISPLPGQYGSDKGIFWATFPTTDIADPEQGELIVRIIVQR